MHYLHPNTQVTDNVLINQLNHVTALDVYKFFYHEAYGIEAPTDKDNPTLCRAHTLDFYKKAISAHVTARNIPWNEGTQVGNPTRMQPCALL
jgi:hypothetical protein